MSYRLRFGPRAAQRVVTVPLWYGNGSHLRRRAFPRLLISSATGVFLMQWFAEGISRDVETLGRLTIERFKSDLVAIGQHLGCDVGLELSVGNHYGSRSGQHSSRRERGSAYI